MSFKEKFAKQYAETYFKKNGDRITQAQGNILSVKVEEKTILWIFHKLFVTILVRPESSRNIVKCTYKKNRWFKKPKFMELAQGHRVLIQGLKGKKGKENRETVAVMNIMNYTTKDSLMPIEGKMPEVKKIRKTQRMR